MYRDTDGPKEHFATITSDFGPYNSKAGSKERVMCAAFDDIAADLIKKFDADDFRSLCKVAIRDGYTSVQDVTTRFGDIIPRNVDKIADNVKWPIPNPAATRELLTFFSTLQNFSGNRLPWRHAQCARAEEAPEPQDSPHMEAAHPHSRPF